MVTSEVEKLFAQTLLGDYEAEGAWAAVAALRRDGRREIFEHAVAWCSSDDPLKRARAVDILSQLRLAPVSTALLERPEWLFRDESYPLVVRILEKEENPLVLSSAIGALGHIGNEMGIPLILRFTDHADPDVRFAVSFALGCFSDDARSVSGLVKLTLDPESNVRDWAVFGLGVLGDADSPEIRETLLRCLSDGNEDVRVEAAVGLGKRRDQRLLPKLLQMLREPELKIRVAEAAAALLGLDRDPPEWESAGYVAALVGKFDAPK